MTFIQYTGSSDQQEFGAADFKKEGVEAKKTVFRRHEAVEVSDEVAELLLNGGKGVFAGYSFEEAEDPNADAPAEDEAPADDPEDDEDDLAGDGQLLIDPDDLNN